MTSINQQASLLSNYSCPFFLSPPSLTLPNPHDSGVGDLQELQDGSFITCSLDKTLKVWSRKGQLLFSFSHSTMILQVVEMRDEQIMFGDDEGKVHVLDRQTNSVDSISSDSHQDGVARMVRLSNDHIATGSHDKAIKIWNVQDKSCCQTLRSHTNSVWAITETKDGSLVSGSNDKTVKIWKRQEKRWLFGWRTQQYEYQLECTLVGHNGYVNSVIELESGLIASSSDDETIRLWDRKTRSCVGTLLGHSDSVCQIEEVEEGIIVSGSHDKTIRVWRAESWECVNTLQVPISVWRVRKMKDGSLLYGAGPAKAVYESSDTWMSRQKKRQERSIEENQQLMNEIKQREESLLAREKAIAAKEEEVKAKVLDIDRKTAQINKLEQTLKATQLDLHVQAVAMEKREREVSVRERKLKTKDAELQAKEAGLKRRERDVKEKEKQANDREQALNHKETEANERQQQVAEKEKQANDREQALNHKETEINERQQQVTEKAKRVSDREQRVKTIERRQKQQDEQEEELERRRQQLQAKEQQLTNGRSMQTKKEVEPKVGMFRLRAIHKATDSFHPQRTIGRGSFGGVYKGELNNIDVAIKRKEGQQKKDVREETEFIQEIAVLGTCRHSSIVPLIGFCIDNNERCLIFPLMKGGPLDRRLQQKENRLSWQQRLEIALQTAEGLAYLHQYENGILHRDVKSGNILLDEHDNARLCDAGLAKFALPSGGYTISASVNVAGARMVGTPGYIDPVFINTGQYTAKSDVYSFGVVMLELLSGHPAIIEGENLADRMQHELQGDISNAVDETCGWPKYVASEMSKVALSCVGPTRSRPSMEGILEKLIELKQKVAPRHQTRDETVNKRGKKTCLVCSLRERESMFLPCHHSATCLDCAIEITSMKGKNRCPLCYVKIDDVQEGEFYDTLVTTTTTHTTNSSSNNN
eukprot:TRINITY_DN1060_c0_g1_i14.p1 TRINITY_DN1060_c0_g1~~TRINITY_DN1060_c0_g1_i14.p1  ORF type:complete len:932 (+),score=310.40 TRINITY_DN1060_c0_g1_i14:270-3065(+)